MNVCEPIERIHNLREHLRERMLALTGEDQAAGIEIASLIRMVSNQYEALIEQQPHDRGLSGPRWGLLLRLAAEEENGHAAVTPTDLSLSENVSKNTISSLLRGLEEQGLVSRELDTADRRIFHIRLTPAGRELIHTLAPLRVTWMNTLVTGLSAAE